MKKTILLGITAAGAAILLASCSDDWGMKSEGRGSIAPLVGVDTQVITSQKSSGSRADGDAVTAADLSIRLTKSDGSWSNSWEKLADFDVTQQFAVGDYLIEAFYGNENEEGFEKPSYAGSQTVTVADQRTTEVALTAAMSKCMISIDYTETFKNYMSSWSASVKGAGSAIEYTADETRPLYLVPGQASITVNVVKPNGLSGSFELAKVSTKARYSYHVTVDVNEGNAGDATLTVSFDENLAHEDVTVDISDEIMNMPPPTIEAAGFEAGVPVTVLSGIDSDLENLSMNIIALGGLKEINLTTKSEYLLSQGWPETVELIGATTEMQSRLTGMGLQTLGIWKNPAEMGVLEFIGVANKIKAIAGDNNSTFTITVTDRLSRVSEPLTLELNAEAVQINTALKDELYAPGQDSEMQVAFSGNLSTLKKALKLQFDHNGSGIWRDITVKDVVEASATKAARAEATPQTLYDVTFVAPAEMSTALTIRAIAGDVITETITLQPLILTVDSNNVFAKSATASVSTTATLFIRAKGESDFSEVATATGSHRITGLASDTEYELKAKAGKKETPVVSFTTEEETPLPNAGFEEWSSEQKGDYQYLWIPADWSTVNATTCSTSGSGSGSGLKTGGTAYKATSGTIPANSRTTKGQDNGGGVGTSTSGDGNTQGNASLHNDKQHTGSNAVLIRTVSWGSGNTAAGGTVFNLNDKKFGTSQNKTPGELFLNGYAFASRPSAVSFYYHYDVVTSGNGDYGTVEVKVLDAAGNVIASASSNITEQASYTAMTLPLTYADGAAKAATISVRFVSSANADIYNSESTSNWRVPGINNTSGGEYTGSELYIDDISLSYEY